MSFVWPSACQSKLHEICIAQLALSLCLPLHWFDSIRLLGDFAAHERIVGARTPHTSLLVKVTANA
jgi:hypothetical protein